LGHGFRFESDVERILSHGEISRVITSSFIFENKAEALVGVILLYTCRQFERQMGTRKFGAFLVLSLLLSMLLQIAFVTIAAMFDFYFIPSPGPYYAIYATLTLFHGM
jgi:membrane associated rhomboid family serine protease